MIRTGNGRGRERGIGLEKGTGTGTGTETGTGNERKRREMIDVVETEMIGKVVNVEDTVGTLVVKVKTIVDTERASGQRLPEKNLMSQREAKKLLLCSSAVS